MLVDDSDRHISIERRLKSNIPNLHKDFGESIPKPVTSPLKTISETPFKSESLAMEVEPLSEKTVFGKKIREKRKTLASTEVKNKVSIDLVGDDSFKLKSCQKTPQNTTTPLKDKVYKLVSKLYMIMKFIKNLRNAAFVRIPNTYQLNRMNILHDATFFKDGWAKTLIDTKKWTKCCLLNTFNFLKILGIFGRLFDWISERKLQKYLVVFDPDKTLRSVWDALHLLVFFLYFFKIPVEISFEIDLFSFLATEFNQTMANSFNYFGVLFILFDMIVNFNTGYYRKGYLIVSRRQIAVNYIKSSFVYDFLSFLAIFFDFQKIPINANFKLLFFFRVSNFFRIFSRIEESIHINFKLFNLLKLLKVVARIVLLSHVFACGWHYISYQQISQSHESWYYFF